MPFISIRLTPPGVSDQDKEKVIAGVTKVMQDVLGKPPQYTFVVIEEVESQSWGIAGKSVARHIKDGTL